jgi:hypothetical protein
MIRSTISRARRPGASRVAAIVVFAATLVSACGNPVTPSPPASASPSIAASPTSSAPSPSAASAAACTTADVTATGGPWGGAAGSRGSDVAVENRGTAPCLLPAGPTVALVDQAGTAILTSAPPLAGAGPELAAGGSIGFSLLLSNWCDQAVSLPLHLRLALASDGIDIDELEVATLDDLPPCNGPGEPASLSATGWEPGLAG